MKNFRPEVEARIAEFYKKHGGVQFGGKLISDVDYSTAVPDNLGGEVQRQIAA